MNHLPAQVVSSAPADAVDELFLGAEEVGRGHNVVIAGGSVHGFQIAVPVDGGREFANLGQSHLVVDVLGIAALDVIHLRLRQEPSRDR